jgi:hypothetical protein
VRLLEQTKVSEPIGRLPPLETRSDTGMPYREERCRVYPTHVEVNGHRYVPAEEAPASRPKQFRRSRKKSKRVLRSRRKRIGSA